MGIESWIASPSVHAAFFFFGVQGNKVKGSARGGVGCSISGGVCEEEEEDVPLKSSKPFFHFESK
jgi:hypothetical protein